ncbi:ABC-type transport auxiliary lipoprotein family protein [Paracoccus laeviglucosivorans]|uniref:Cholesterol transport system auxiliary component n=1 Tax=Paracoccus laeviglucosivorans TaxID=1197861 RepID=A0A521FFR3_9RHOB|nr:ABC-type transport auxiliary lipoprotein family protein [Paracoccus laeviglucosivorans]SMO95027.1 cholesterol transport system auxiliary component [Paracoccus laeviglucosivorans]
MNRMTLAFLALTMALPGCAAVSALSGGPKLDVFELRPLSDAPKTCGRGRLAELVIEEPKTRGTLNTERIMIRPSALQTQYLPDAQWGDTVPITLQNLLVRGFGSYDAFTHVGRAPLGSAGDYALISEINDFNAEVSGSGAVVKLSVSAQLVNEMDARVVSRGNFSATSAAASTRTADLVPAFDAAGQELLAQMTNWGLRGVGVNPSACR